MRFVSGATWEIETVRFPKIVVVQIRVGGAEYQGIRMSMVQRVIQKSGLPAWSGETSRKYR
jgi:hypothetical protein